MKIIFVSVCSDFEVSNWHMVYLYTIYFTYIAFVKLENEVLQRAMARRQMTCSVLKQAVRVSTACMPAWLEL